MLGHHKHLVVYLDNVHVVDYLHLDKLIAQDTQVMVFGQLIGVELTQKLAQMHKVYKNMQVGCLTQDVVKFNYTQVHSSQ